MRQQTPTEIALIKVVNAHLKQLADALKHDVDEATLRVASSSLRFLLPEEGLARAWRASGIGGPMVFKVWCITSTSGPNVVAYCGGGDVLPGIPFSACRGATLGELTLDLGTFCKKARIQIGETKISTVQLIQYVANTLGGAHFDPEGKSLKSKKAPFDLLRRLEANEISDVPFLVNDRNLLHHEVFSIAQALIRSPSVALIRQWQGAASAA